MSSLPEHFHAAYRFNSERLRANGRTQKQHGEEIAAKGSQRVLRSRPSPGVNQEGQDDLEVKKRPASRPTASTTPHKRRRVNARTETFSSALYPHVTDHLCPTDTTRQLDILICGLNPGLRSSQKGLHFAHPSNHFYRTLYLGGLTPIVVKPEDCAALVDQQRISIGLTNICCRPTREGSQLKREDFLDGTPQLNLKIARMARPRLTVFTGKGIGSEWVKCCKDVGALGSVKKSNVVKKEDDDDKGAVPRPRTVTLLFPHCIPFAPDEPQGLGLMPYVLDLADDDDVDSSTSSHSRYSFLFLVTSPSGRVTTMHLPEKGQWMGKARECLEYLWSRECTRVKEEDREADDKVKTGSPPLVLRQFEVVELTPVSHPT